MNNAEFIVRKATPDDDAAVIAILNRARSDMPPSTVESMRYYDATIPEEKPRERHVAEQDGKILGFLMLQNSWWTDQPGSFSLNIDVDLSARGRGVGTRLYVRALERATQLKVARLASMVREDDLVALRFAAQRGFEPTGYVHRMSRLEVGSANLAAFAGIGRSLDDAGGIRIKSLAELGGGEELLRGAYEVDRESGLDSPNSEPTATPPFDQWLKLLQEPGVSADTLFLALDGDRPVGLSNLSLGAGGIADTGYTGVLRAYRGRGVASALKVAVTEWARDNGIRYIYTSNDLRNAPMLAINVKLGYQPLAARVELVKHLLQPPLDPHYSRSEDELKPSR